MNMRDRLLTVVAALAIMGACVTPLLGADPLTEQQKAKRKLMAQRAARVDAIRKLAERIKGLTITSETTVQDFVAESDTIRTALDAWLGGMKEVGKPKHMADGTCEVRMQVTLREVVANLKRIHKRYSKGRKVSISDFEKIIITSKLKVIEVVGHGAMKEDDPFEDEPLILRKGEGSVFSNLHGEAKAYWLAHCKGRGRLMAERAASVDAMRRLAERIKGVHITSRTTVQDFVAESDEINVSMRTFLAGSREIGVRYHKNELIVEVERQVKLRTVYASLRTWAQTHYKGDKINIQKIEKLVLKAKETVVREVGMGVPPAKYLKDVPPAVQAVMQTAARAPAWISQSLRAVGDAAIDTENPNKAQRKLMARRAAELDARRKLAEQLQGLVITSETSVQDFVAQNDEIRTAMIAYQQGVRVIESSFKELDDGTVKITVETDLKPLWNMIIHYQRKLSITIK